MRAQMANMNIPRTRQKLREAGFFLDQMELQAWPKTHDPHDWDVFGFYLSAFLSAAISVSWVLRKENKKLYQRVYPDWKTGMGPDDLALLDFMYDCRVKEATSKGLKCSAILGSFP